MGLALDGEARSVLLRRQASMSDFFQTGAIATLHRLGRPNVTRLEQELERFSEETPMALVLPCHIKELGTRALRLIVRELKNVTYIKQIVVGIDGATRARDYHKARRFFRQLPQRPMLLWNDGPRMTALFQKLEEAELSPGVTEDFRGCAFVKAAAEYAESADPIHKLAADHKRRIIETLGEMCHAAQLPEPERLARRLALLKEGAIADATIAGDATAAAEAKLMAVRLL